MLLVWQLYDSYRSYQPQIFRMTGPFPKAELCRCGCECVPAHLLFHRNFAWSMKGAGRCASGDASGLTVL